MSRAVATAWLLSDELPPPATALPEAAVLPAAAAAECYVVIGPETTGSPHSFCQYNGGHLN